MDAVRAATLSDKEILEIAAQAARESDRKHTLAAASSAQALRLRRLAGQEFREGSQDFNVAVYVSPEVNAFAMADGTIRVYAGLMDLLDDGELLFVIGHETGHVTQEHIRKKIRLAYAASAVRKGIASQGGAAGDLAGSLVGGLAEALLNAQFSQLEEKEADDAGLTFLRRKAGNPGDAVSALQEDCRPGPGALLPLQPPGSRSAGGAAAGAAGGQGAVHRGDPERGRGPAPGLAAGRPRIPHGVCCLPGCADRGCRFLDKRPPCPNNRRHRERNRRPRKACSPTAGRSRPEKKVR